MFPHQLVGVAIRRVRREKEQHQLSAQRFNKGLGLLGAMCGPAIDDQEDLALRSDQKSLQKFDEHIRIHAAGFFDHKTHMTFGSYRRDQTDAVPGSRRLDDRRFTLLSPRAPRVMIRTHVRRVSKIDVRTLHLRHFPDLRIFSLQPSLHERLIAFESAMQRFLTGDTQLRQQPAHGHRAQDNLESGLDDLCHHLARPQRKFKFELQGILLRYRFVNPFQFLVVQLWWTTKKRFRLQGAPATLTITRQPPKHRTIGYAQRPRYNRRSLARLDAANRPFPQSFQRLVIQPARVVFSHAATESEPINLVKENMHLLTFRLIGEGDVQLLAGHRTIETTERDIDGTPAPSESWLATYRANARTSSSSMPLRRFRLSDIPFNRTSRGFAFSAWRSASPPFSTEDYPMSKYTVSAKRSYGRRRSQDSPSRP